MVTGLGQAFEFTAPANGRLAARLTWNDWLNGTGMTLHLMADTEFAPEPPLWSPLVGTWNITAGQNYRLTIGPYATDWAYNDPFVLTAVE